MSTNLIQNFINKPQVQVQNAPAKKEVPNFNIQQELNNRTFIKPLRGRGKLLSGNILNAPLDLFKDTNYNIKALGHAIKGEANDHELGRLNDVGMMAGGLAIASYLYSKKTTPLTKGMEFVGLASFMASMAIWPKIAIQLPAYLIHGVNVQKQYEDSFGRRKPFYQDPQFIPWDLYSDKEIDKIGDRLGVPKNIKNRREFIQEKMKKIAVQNNTLWMLTAGFATPIMSALICNQIEPHLLKFQNDYRNKKADNILKDIDKHSKKYQDNNIEIQLKKVFEKNNGKPINDELLEQIVNIFSRDLDPVTSKAILPDLKSMLTDGNFKVTEDCAKKISENLKNVLLKEIDCSKEDISAIIPSEADLLGLFNNKNLLNRSINQTEINQIQVDIMKEIAQRLKSYKNQNQNVDIDIADIKEAILSKTTQNHPIKRVLGAVESSVLDEVAQGKLIKGAKIFDMFRAKNASLDEYALIKCGSAPETILANYWNDVSKDLLNTLGIKYSEFEKIRFDRGLVSKLLRDKIENVVADKDSYQRVMNQLVTKIAEIDKQIKPSDITSHLLNGQEYLSDEQKIAARTEYEKAVDTVFDGAARQMRDAGFTRVARSINGFGGVDETGTYKHIQKAFGEERLLGVKSSFYRLINTLDFYRRVATNPNDLHAYNGKLPREVMEELIELCKIVTLEGHSSDHATKFYMLRNPNPSMDTSPLEVKDGKVIYKYYGKTTDGVDLPSDKHFYQNAMKFMFADDMHEETKEILGKHVINDEVAQYRRLVVEKLGGEKYFAKPRHLISGSKDTGSDIKFLLTGIAPDELIFKTGQQAFNTKKWLKMFGGFGAGLLGVTVLAQFFFGKLKDPKKVGNK